MVLELKIAMFDIGQNASITIFASVAKVTSLEHNIEYNICNIQVSTKIGCSVNIK
jgi:hypothetical protein